MGTKRQVQLTGVRKWFGNQMQQMQDNIYEHLENLLLRYGTGQLIIKEPTFDSDHNVTDVGYVLMNGGDGFKTCEISGSYSGSGGSTFYLTQEFQTVDQDVYTDSGSTKDISRKYVAADRSAQPSSPYLKVTDYTIYDENDNEVPTLQELFYTQTAANDSTQNSIEASKLQGKTFSELGTPVDTLVKYSPTQDDVFQWLKNYIPSNGNKIKVNGGGQNTDEIIVFVYAERTDSTTIKLYMVNSIDAYSLNMNEGYRLSAFVSIGAAI